jgi:hypothetical protein
MCLSDNLGDVHVGANRSLDPKKLGCSTKNVARCFIATLESSLKPGEIFLTFSRTYPLDSCFDS